MKSSGVSFGCDSDLLVGTPKTYINMYLFPFVRTLISVTAEVEPVRAGFRQEAGYHVDWSPVSHRSHGQTAITGLELVQETNWSI